MSYSINKYYLGVKDFANRFLKSKNQQHPQRDLYQHFPRDFHIYFARNIARIRVEDRKKVFKYNKMQEKYSTVEEFHIHFHNFEYRCNWKLDQYVIGRTVVYSL